jgi:hypothetical protein
LNSETKPSFLAKGVGVFKLIIKRRHKMYAVVFDLDQETLSETYHNDSYKNAYGDIKKVLETHGFSRQQGTEVFILVMLQRLMR